MKIMGKGHKKDIEQDNQDFKNLQEKLEELTTQLSKLLPLPQKVSDIQTIVNEIKNGNRSYQDELLQQQQQASNKRDNLYSLLEKEQEEKKLLLSQIAQIPQDNKKSSISS